MVAFTRTDMQYALRQMVIAFGTADARFWSHHYLRSHTTKQASISKFTSKPDFLYPPIRGRDHDPSSITHLIPYSPLIYKGALDISQLVQQIHQTKHLPIRAVTVLFRQVTLRND